LDESHDILLGLQKGEVQGFVPVKGSRLLLQQVPEGGHHLGLRERVGQLIHETKPGTNVGDRFWGWEPFNGGQEFLLWLIPFHCHLKAGELDILHGELKFVLVENYAIVRAQLYIIKGMPKG
jgi:hypothetical protein